MSVNDDALHDPDSGLLNEATTSAPPCPTGWPRARRVLRPLSIALLSLRRPRRPAHAARRELAEQVSYGLLETLRESDTPCRLDDGSFGVLLEDTPESGAVWTVERLRRLLADQGIELTVWAASPRTRPTPSRPASCSCGPRRRSASPGSGRSPASRSPYRSRG